MSPTEAGKVFSRLVLFIELQYIFVLKLTRGKKRFLTIFLGFMPVTMSKITNFFLPSTSSDRGKCSNASLNSNNNNKDEEDDPPPKRSLKSTSSEAIGASCASFKKYSRSSEGVDGIINNMFTEDQKKVLHHYHRCRERNCSGLRTGEKQRLSSKKNKFQHEWLFDANVFCEKTGLRWLVFVEGEGMYCLICKKYKSTNQQIKQI